MSKSAKRDGSRLIPLTNGHVAIVDVEDFERVNQFKWYAKKGSDGKCYAARGQRSGGAIHTILMHRFIMDCPVGKEIDHKDTVRLNNRRANLDIVSRAENMKRRWRK